MSHASLYSLNHGFADDHLIDELAQFTSHRLSVLEAHIHGNRLTLKHLNLAADATQVRLESVQHPFHRLQFETNSITVATLQYNKYR